jgi:hypothetical protein
VNVFFALFTLLFSGLLVISAFLTLGVLCIQVWIYNRQLKEMQKASAAATLAAKAAKDSVISSIEGTHLDQRAWVACDGVVLKHGRGQPITATVLFKNTGKTFAKQCFVSSDRMAKPLTDADPDFDTVMQNAKKRTLGVIAPGQQVPYTMSTACQSGNPNAAVSLIFGKIIYRDVFNCDHWTTFCYCVRQNSLGSLSVEVYGSYNDADNN